jgi:hypothetical protein
MPKMYRLASGSSCKWEFVDTDQNDKVLARSLESYRDDDEAIDAIKDLKRANKVRKRDGTEVPV